MKVFKISKTCEGARKMCQNYSGDLVTILNDIKFHFINGKNKHTKMLKLNIDKHRFFTVCMG